MKAKKQHKPSLTNNYNWDDAKVQKFKESYPTTKNSDLATLFGISVHQVHRLGKKKLYLTKDSVLRGPAGRRTKKCWKCKEVKDLARSYESDDHNNCIKCTREKEGSSWRSRTFNPIFSKSKRDIKPDPPKWWVNENKKLISNG